MNRRANLTVADVDLVFTGSEVLTCRNVHVTGSRIEAVEDAMTAPDSAFQKSTNTIDGRGKALIPGFKNSHTHAAMTLLRGYGDDMALQTWLETSIWPAEAQLTAEDVYWGTRLAAMEMIRSGTTFANDMYFYPREIVRAFSDAGIKAAVGLAFFDFFDSDKRSQQQNQVDTALSETPGSLAKSDKDNSPPNVTLAIAPHSIYTCSPELLRWARKMADETQLVLHTHLSETETEVRNAVRDFGSRPFVYANDLGLLGPDTIAAHAVWLDTHEFEIAGESGVTVAYNPASNMKLASGAFPYTEFAARGIPMMLAPDGVASNNNLDMFDEMKLASLLQKHHFKDPERLPAIETLRMATGALARLFPGVSGRIAAGEPADFVLVDLDHPQMVPTHNLVSNLVYAANGSVVDTVVCAGRVLMNDRKIPGSEEVIREARRCATHLAARTNR